MVCCFVGYGLWVIVGCGLWVVGCGLWFLVFGCLFVVRGLGLWFGVWVVGSLGFGLWGLGFRV